jgi:hypothetical protein
LKPGLPEHEVEEVTRGNAVQSGRKLLKFRRNLMPETYSSTLKLEDIVELETERAQLRDVRRTERI